MKNVLFFTCEPGGAETLGPLIRLLTRQKDYEIIVLAYGHGLARFRQKGISCIETRSIQKDDLDVIETYKPDFIITSATSLPNFDMSEKHLWQNARKAGVKTLAFLDQWQNYAIRFSGPSEEERLSYLPDFINCINQTGRSEMLAAGFDGAILLTLGHPYLSTIREVFNSIDPDELMNKLSSYPGQGDPKNTVLFVSEALREHYGDSLGYDQYQALDYFLKNAEKSPRKPSVLIKLHPKDIMAGYTPIAARYESFKPVFVQNELTALECLHAVDTVFGMTSMLLVEAFLLGKTVVSVQPGLKVEDPLVLSRHKYIPLLRDYSSFDVLGFHPGRVKDFNVIFDEESFLNVVAAGIRQRDQLPTANKY
jgi:hypothetical protein